MNEEILVYSNSTNLNLTTEDLNMKDYQNLIGKLLIAGAIIVASLIVANALENLGQLINAAAMSLGNLIS